MFSGSGSGTALWDGLTTLLISACYPSADRPASGHIMGTLAAFSIAVARLLPLVLFPQQVRFLAQPPRQAPCGPGIVCAHRAVGNPICGRRGPLRFVLLVVFFVPFVVLFCVRLALLRLP
jgi:hypothetical protein